MRKDAVYINIVPCEREKTDYEVGVAFSLSKGWRAMNFTLEDKPVNGIRQGYVSIAEQEGYEPPECESFSLPVKRMEGEQIVRVTFRDMTIGLPISRDDLIACNPMITEHVEDSDSSFHVVFIVKGERGEGGNGSYDP